MAQKIDNDLLYELECPICSEYMQPPIQQCKTGHSFCNICFSKISTCSICKSAKSRARSFALEKLSEKYKVPCKNHQYGCMGIYNLKDMEVHIKECDHRNISCPSIKNCKWSDQINELYDHCQTTHKNLFKSKDVLKDVGLNATLNITFANTLVKVENEVFLCRRTLSNNHMCFTVYHFGKKSDSKKFIFKITILKNPFIKLQAKCQPCHIYYKEKERNLSGVTIDMNQILEYSSTTVDGEEYILYTVEIKNITNIFT